MIWISFAIDWELALLSLTVVPFLYYSVGYYMRNIQDRLYQVKGMEGQSLSIIHEAISMIRVIIAFGREKYEHQRYRDQSEQAMAARVRLTVRQTLFTLAVDGITAAGSALVLGVGAYHVLQHRLSVGQLLVIMAYIAAVYKPLEAISSTVGSFQDIFTSMKFAYDILDLEPDIKDEPGAIDVGRAVGDVEFDDVSFAYAGRVATLQSVTFRAKPGQVVAVVGPTGAGKTTLISLLPRFYDAESGRILLDGIDIRRMTLRSLRDQVSIVLQEPLLFSGAIRDNIRYGKLDATDDEIVEAARAANAHDFIERLPHAYDTDLGERGAMLSGGERQRIAVARAFLKNAPILILDEPTSSIDSKTEAVILDALDRLMAGRTTFMIAHRLSTIRRADMILVLDRGMLVEQGSHETLLKSGGLYQHLFEMQTHNSRRTTGSFAP
jgi:ABC-type multidrug transport system fused ATPase/permease subunit